MLPAVHHQLRRIRRDSASKHVEELAHAFDIHTRVLVDIVRVDDVEAVGLEEVLVAAGAVI